MNCSRVRASVFLYADNEMGEDLLIVFRAHLDRCPECAHHVDHAQRLLAVVRQRCRRTPAPSHLRQRIQESLREGGAGRRERWE